MKSILVLIYVLAVSAAFAADLMLDDCKTLSNWKLDPHPAEQKHSLEVAGGALLYQSAGEGKHSYSQFIWRDLNSRLKTQERYDFLTFDITGDGCSVPMYVIVFCTDGSRWQHRVDISNTEQKTVSLKFRDFKFESQGNRKSDSLYPDSRMINQISFWFDKRAPRRIELRGLGVNSPDYNAAAPGGRQPQVEFYPATTHRDKQSFLLPGQVTPLVIYLGEMKGLDTPVLRLKMPATMQFVAATAGDNYKAEILKNAPVESVPGVWDFLLQDDICGPGKISKFQKNLNCFVTTPPDAKPGSGILEWSLISRDKVVAGGKVSVETLPPLAVLPREASRIRRYIYTTILFAAPQQNVRQSLADTFEKAGISGGVVYPQNIRASQELIARNWKLYRHAFNWWDNWGCFLGDLSAPADEIRGVLANGQKSKKNGTICPQWLLEHSKPDDEYFNKAKAKLVGYVIPGMAGFLNDHEMLWDSEISPANSCFCPRCLDAFARRNQLNTGDLTPQKILSDYRQKWYDFRFDQQGELIGVYDKIVKSIDPSLRSAICSFVVTPSRYEVPINIASYDGKVDEHWPMCYKSGVSYHNELENTLKGVHSPVTVLLNNCDPIGERLYIPPDQFELNLLSALTSGARGVGIFTGDISLDGEYLTILNRTQNLISPLEKYFLDGSRSDSVFRVEGIADRVEEQNVFGRKIVRKIPDWAPFLRSRVFALEGEYLLCTYNYSPGAPGLLNAALITGGGDYFVYNPKTRQRINSPSGKARWTSPELECGVPAVFYGWECCFLLFSPVLYDGFAEIAPEAIHKEYQNNRAAAASPHKRTLTIPAGEPAVYPLGPVSATSKMTEAGTVSLYCDRNNLYAQFIMTDHSVRPGRSGNDVEVWASDCAELFLSDGALSYYHFGVNPAGGRYDAKDRDAAWSGKWEVTVADAPQGWNAKFTIPWETLNLKGSLQGNFARENMPSGELSAVIPNGGDFHSRNGFAELVTASPEELQK